MKKLGNLPRVTRWVTDWKRTSPS